MIIHITPKTNDGFRAIEDNSIFVGFLNMWYGFWAQRGLKKMYKA